MKSLNKLKRLIMEVTSIYIPINEMSKIGVFDQYTVIIESLDHNPPHFHVKLSNKTVTRLEIPKDYPQRTYDLVYLKNQTRLSSQVEKALILWMTQPDKNAPKYTNLESLQIEWNRLHS